MSSSFSTSSTSSTSPRVRPDLAFDATQRGGSKFWNDLFASFGDRVGFCMAPLHESSDHPMRVFMRQQGNADFCYTPMIHANNFSRASPEARDEEFYTSPTDRPLVVQFAAASADDLIASALAVQHHCDAIDINLGCPQKSARAGNYGAFLCENPDAVIDMIRKFKASAVQLPLWIKMRVFDDVDSTVELARRFEAAGVSLIAVHGRTRHQIGPNRGDADESKIAAVARALSIPVIANGNVRTRADALRIGRETGAVAVMCGWPLLHLTPFVFCETPPTTMRSEMVLRYLDYAVRFPDNCKFLRKHVFELLQPLLIAHGMHYFDLLNRIHVPEPKDFHRFVPLVNEIRELELRVTGGAGFQ
jgi:tRNA-dihydrouridine synthase 1